MKGCAEVPFLFPKIIGCYFSLKISTCYKYGIITTFITYKTMIL